MAEEAFKRSDFAEESFIQAPLDLSANIEVLIKSNEELLKSTKDLSAVAQNATGSKQLETATQALINTNKKLVVTQQEIAKESLKNSQNNDKQTKSYSDGEKEVRKYQGAVARLRRDLLDARDDLAGIGAALGTSSKEYIEAAKNVGALELKLKGLSSASKGAITSQLDNLSNSFGTLQSKIKSLDFKGATSAITKMATAIKGLTFKEATDGLGAFIKSIGGLARAILTNPIFLLVATVVLIGTAVIKLKDKIYPLVIAFEYMGKAMKFVTQLAKDFSDSLGISAFAAEDKADRIIASAKREQDALVYRYDNEIKLAQAAAQSTVYLEVLKQRAISDTAIKTKKALESYMDASSRTYKQLTEDQQKAYAEAKKQIEDASVEIRAILRRDEVERKKKVKEQHDDAFDLATFRLQLQIKNLEDIAKNEANSLKSRTDAEIAAEKLRVDLVNVIKLHGLEQDKITAAKRQKINEEALAAIASNEKKSALEKTNILISVLTKEKEIADAIIEKENSTYTQRIQAVIDFSILQNQVLEASRKSNLISEKEYERQLVLNKESTSRTLLQIDLKQIETEKKIKQQKINSGADNELGEINRQYAERELSTRKFFKKQKALEIDAQLDLYHAAADAAIKKFNLLQQSGEDTLAAEAEINSAVLGLEQTYADIRLEKEAQIQDALNNLRTEGSQAALQIVQNFFDAGDQLRADNLNKLERQASIELQLVGDNEARKAQIQNKFAADKEKLRLQQVAADRKKANFDKATAAFSIGINTARAAIEVLPNYIASALIIALGAIQLGAVLTKPIPQYKDGTKNHTGGLAVVGDGAGAELLYHKNTGFDISPSKATLMDLAPGTQVFNHRESMRMIAQSGLRPNDSTLGDRSDTGWQELRKDIRSLIHTTKTKREFHINYSRKGAEAMIRKADNAVKMMNDFFG